MVAVALSLHKAGIHKAREERVDLRHGLAFSLRMKQGNPLSGSWNPHQTLQGKSWVSLTELFPEHSYSGVPRPFFFLSAFKSMLGHQSLRTHLC